MSVSLVHPARTASTDLTNLTASDIVNAPDAIRAAYTAGDTKVRGSIRAQVKKITWAALGTMDTPTMTAGKSLADSLTATAPRPAVDSSAVTAQRIADLTATLAQVMESADAATSQHLAYGMVGNVNEKIASSVFAASTGTRAASGDLAAAFAALESGVYTVAQVQAATGLIKSGGVAARLFPATGECTLPNVTPLERGDEGDEGQPMVVRGVRVH